MKLRVSILLACLLAGVSWMCRAQVQEASAYRVEIASSVLTGISDDIAQALQPAGVRLVNKDGKTVGELWLRATVPLKANASGYAGLSEGVLMGVLSLPLGGYDFRGQPIKPGDYTLRYERLPDDAHHLGVAPENNFVLLCPAAADAKLDAAFDFDQLVELSRQASGANHPASLLLLPAAGRMEFPSVQRSGFGYIAVRAKTLGTSSDSRSTQDFPIAVVLVGKAKEL